MNLQRFRRTLLGVVVGASFGVVIGALIASWVLGVRAGSTDLAPGIVIALVVTASGALGGGVIAWRLRPASDEQET